MFDTDTVVIDNTLNNNDNLINENTLVIPKVNNSIFDYYQVEKGDTLYKIATDNNLSPNLLAELNGLNIDDYIYPKQVLLIPKNGTILYFTAIGDTLQELANGLNVDIMDLINQNSKIYLQPEQLIVYKYK